MRGEALLGGLLFVVAVGATHHLQACPSDADGPMGLSCAMINASEVCQALDGLSAAVRSSELHLATRNILPPADVPGSIDPTITQANIDTTICRPGYARAVRPPAALTEPLKRQLMEGHHPGERLADYELDHLIPISLGGAPFDQRDLWLQPRQGRANAGDKNVLAYVLWRLVCEHRLALQTAQGAISLDWIGAYRNYATPENIARYHFRHGTDEQARVFRSRNAPSK